MTKIERDLIIPTLRYCRKMGWKTYFHKSLSAWGVSYTKKDAGCWLNAIGLIPKDNGIQISFIGGFCRLFTDIDRIKNFLEYTLTPDAELQKNEFVCTWYTGVSK